MENYLDFDVMVKFIQARLEQDEVAVPQEVIELILDLEMEYMIENGFASTEVE